MIRTTASESVNHVGNRLRTAAFGAIVMALGMGIGRFLYTPLLPAMLAEGHFTFGQLSYIASANYAGYLAGSLLFSFGGFGRSARASLMLLATAAATGVLLLAMAFAANFLLVMAIRFAAGVASAAVMIFGSLVVLRHTHDIRVIASLFAGVGIGILLGNGYVNVGLRHALDAASLWQGAGLLSVALLPALFVLSPRAAGDASRPAPALPQRDDISWWRLALLYGLAGFGYIIVATYLPLMAKSFDFPLLANRLWSLVGLAIVPGCFVWLWAARRWGTLPCLAANLLIQGACVLLTLPAHAPALLVISSIGFGATFMGTTSLVMPLARRLRAPHGINLLGLVTLTHGIGQILGPLLTGLLQSGTNAVAPAIACGAAALFIAAGISLPRGSSAATGEQ